MKHQIRPIDFYKYQIFTELAGSYGKDSAKSLIYFTEFGHEDTVEHWYEVREHKNIVLKTYCRQSAIDKYNSLP